MNMPSFARPGLLCVKKTNGGSIGEPVPRIENELDHGLGTRRYMTRLWLGRGRNRC